MGTKFSEDVIPLTDLKINPGLRPSKDKLIAAERPFKVRSNR